MTERSTETKGMTDWEFFMPVYKKVQYIDPNMVNNPSRLFLPKEIKQKKMEKKKKSNYRLALSNNHGYSVLLHMLYHSHIKTLRED